MRGIAKNIVEATCSLCLASNNRYCHPADGILDTNIILLSHAICSSYLQKWGGYPKIFVVEIFS
jgi:hypothetical protein